MSPLQLLHLALIFHLSGLALMAGTTFLDFVTMRRFWREFKQDTSKAIIMRQAMLAWPRILMAGIALLILSGIVMMAITKGVFGEQLWFRAKIGLVLIIVLNGMLVGRRWHKQLDDILSFDRPESIPVDGLRNRIRIYHISQLILFLLVIGLSTFKFN